MPGIKKIRWQSGGKEAPLVTQLCSALKRRAEFFVYNQAIGGEGGIRTLGPPQEGQRFSRPPRSTAPAPLRLSGGNDLARQSREQQENADATCTQVGLGSGSILRFEPNVFSVLRPIEQVRVDPDGDRRGA